ncbi:unnamed protein product, partial [Dovyalis caffra]
RDRRGGRELGMISLLLKYERRNVNPRDYMKLNYVPLNGALFIKTVELLLMLVYSEGPSLISTLTVQRVRYGRLLHLVGQVWVGVLNGKYQNIVE